MNRGDSRTKVFITDLCEGQHVDDNFLVSKKVYAETKAGKPYLALTLMDRTGEIEARVWEGADRYNPLTESGSFIRIKAVAKSYKDLVAKIGYHRLAYGGRGHV